MMIVNMPAEEKFPLRRKLEAMHSLNRTTGVRAPGGRGLLNSEWVADSVVPVCASIFQVSPARRLWEPKFPAFLSLLHQRGSKMSRHNEMPPVPPANRSHKGTGDNTEAGKDTSKTKREVNTAEQGDTANIKQNTTNAGFFKGRRVK